MQRELVEQAQEGDVDAFTQLMRLSAPRLTSVAYLILNDTERAKDAVQDALVKAWRDMGALRDPDAWDAWIRRLTVNICLQVARRDKRRTVLERQAAPAPSAMSIDDATVDVTEREWILSELNRIDIDQRSVLVLHYYLDLPMREVAETIGIPMGTASSRLHRGLEALRASMNSTPVTTVETSTEQSS